MVQSQAGETLDNGERQPPETCGGFSYNTASMSQEQHCGKGHKEVLALPPGHREMKGLSGTARFSWYKTPGLILTKYIFVPAAGVTCDNDKIQGGKAERVRKTTFSLANI